MRVELPQFKRCCCCLPLRYGILVYGYLKLVLDILIMIPMLFAVVELSRRRMLVVIFPTLILLVLLLDVGLTLTFLVGGHKKNVHLLRIYYIYSLVLLGLISLLMVVHIFNELYYLYWGFWPAEYISEFITYLSFEITLGLFLIGIQAYFILLIRSEVIKLKNNCEFRFENIASEALCRMEEGPGALQDESSRPAAPATVTVTQNDEQSEGATEQEDKGNFRYAKMTQQ